MSATREDKASRVTNCHAHDVRGGYFPGPCSNRFHWRDKRGTPPLDDASHAVRAKIKPARSAAGGGLRGQEAFLHCSGESARVKQTASSPCAPNGANWPASCRRKCETALAVPGPASIPSDGPSPLVHHGGCRHRARRCDQEGVQGRDNHGRSGACARGGSGLPPPAGGPGRRRPGAAKGPLRRRLRASRPHGRLVVRVPGRRCLLSGRRRSHAGAFAQAGASPEQPGRLLRCAHHDRGRRAARPGRSVLIAGTRQGLLAPTPLTECRACRSRKQYWGATTLTNSCCYQRKTVNCAKSECVTHRKSHSISPVLPKKLSENALWTVHTNASLV